MPFKPYQHIERLGTDETEGIELGTVHVFPKIDGTNASIWWEDGTLRCGSRNRELGLMADNHGFCAWVQSSPQVEKFAKFFATFPELVLYGEWLVPHTLKTYRGNAWREFWVFDVWGDKGWVPYDEYANALAMHDIHFISRQAIITDPTRDQLYEQMERNTFLIEDGKGIGEGIVIKNYDYQNKYGRQTWAKIVRNEFKEANQKEFGQRPIQGRSMVEREIVNEYVTLALVDKVVAAVTLCDCSYDKMRIPQILGRVWHDLISEEAWNMVKKFKNPTIDFKLLNRLCINKVKELKKELF